MQSGNRSLICVGIAGLLVGPMVSVIAGGLQLPDGATGATALTSGDRVLGSGLLLVALSIIAASGTLAARLSGARTGALCAGIVAMWIALRQGSPEGVILHARSGEPLIWLAIESAIVGACMPLLLWILHRASDQNEDARGSRGSGRSVTTIGAVGAAAAAGLLGVQLFGVESLKGQTIFAAFVASILAGAASRLVVSAHEDVAVRRATVTAMGGVAILALAGPLAAIAAHGREVVEAAFAGRMIRVANPAPLDWLAGGLLGVPIGVWWASAMMPPDRAER
ncbi:MAG: hypothetical protein KF912_02315 [Phycisphaeraceae bacterium]|nr:hypothetical protein [Phycisphaeraceae bacterium]